ncbi:MAG: anti-sigma factor family protein [Longimicrobiales bacterium]
MNCDKDCEDVLLKLWDYLDDELDDARIDEVRGHLERCTGCRGYAEVSRAFLALLPDTPVPEAELGRVRARILEALRKEGLAR